MAGFNLKDKLAGLADKAPAMPSFGGKRAAALNSVISVDAHAETIGFYLMEQELGSIQYNVANCKTKAYDAEFFDRFGKIIKLYREKFPQADLQTAAIVLPDQLFLTDTISIPMIHKKAMQHSMSLAVEAIYKNAEDLNLITYTVQQNKQNATFGLVGMRRDVREKVQAVCAENGINVAGVTFAANSMVNGAFALNHKLKNGTFLLLDIKEDMARFAFVVRGCTMGYYDLPFGHGMLYKSRLAAEDMLFDHRAGDLLVLNAKERARAKQLTMEEGQGVSEEENEGEEAFGLREETASYTTTPTGEIKKTARKLPKSMLRPTPQSREEYVYENFRIFLKWTLDLIAGNTSITALAPIETVYVNMPAEYGYLFDMVNAEQEEHKVTFMPLLAEETEEKIASNLELYGGFYMNQFNQANMF